MNYATIGTGKIVKEFIETAKQFEELNYTICYSRQENTAETFLANVGVDNVQICTSLDNIKNIDFVYIASPNGLHYEQAKFFLQKKVHVLLEKPATFLASEITELKQIANENKVILMEAIKNIHNPQFVKLIAKLNDMQVNSAVFNENSYSSRMNDVNNQVFNSVFDAKLGKGNVYDILVYPVELAVALFGKVEEIKSISTKLANGVSVLDFIIIKHLNGIITSITSSKNNYQTINSQIFAKTQSIEIQNTGQISSFAWKDHVANKKEIISRQENEMVMHGEIFDFIEIIRTKDFVRMNKLLDITIETIRVLEEVASNSL